MSATTSRTNELFDWANTQLTTSITDTTALKKSAGFRRYFRLQLADNTSVLAVDSPSPSDNNAGFMQLSDTLAQLGFTVPNVLAADEQRGFLLVTDLGDVTFEQGLTSYDLDQLYKRALDTLVELQAQSNKPPFTTLPIFDQAQMQHELNQCQLWFLQQWLGIAITPAVQQQLTALFTNVVQQVTQQPTTLVHADYQCRNIMVLADNTLGLLDFQGACIGPITYDVASLLWDCYLDWPTTQVMQWLDYYYAALCDHTIITPVGSDIFHDWFFWSGLQRHFKKFIYFFA